MVEFLIEKYNLQPHPEGGHYRQVYASKQKVTSPINQKERSAVTQIYFLLRMGEVSRFHKVLHDEIWHHYAGAPLTLHQYDGETVETQTIGGKDGEYTAVVPGGLFQAAESSGEYSLVGCTVAPGFDFADFTFIEDSKTQVKLLNHYPNFQRFL